jgi:hypothetical protein
VKPPGDRPSADPQIDVIDLQDARCLRCGYQICGLAKNRCPECGTDFDPTNPWTFDTPRPMGRVVRLLARPVSTEKTIVFAACSFAILWGESAFAGGRVVTMAAIAALVAFCVYWVFRDTVAIAVRHRYRFRIVERSPRWPTVLLALVTLVTATGFTRWVLYEAAYSPFRYALLNEYEAPVSASSKWSTWYGPVPIWRDYAHSYSRANFWFTPVGFHYGLGSGFQATMIDQPDGSVRIVVTADRIFR